MRKFNNDSFFILRKKHIFFLHTKSYRKVSCSPTVLQTRNTDGTSTTFVIIEQFPAAFENIADVSGKRWNLRHHVFFFLYKISRSFPILKLIVIRFFQLRMEGGARGWIMRTDPVTQPKFFYGVGWGPKIIILFFDWF